MFHNSWNKAAASQIVPMDFILFLFSDYSRKIINILLYFVKYCKILRNMMKRIFYVNAYLETKTSKIVSASKSSSGKNIQGNRSFYVNAYMTKLRLPRLFLPRRVRQGKTFKETDLFMWTHITKRRLPRLFLSSKGFVRENIHWKQIFLCERILRN